MSRPRPAALLDRPQPTPADLARILLSIARAAGAEISLLDPCSFVFRHPTNAPDELKDVLHRYLADPDIAAEIGEIIGAEDAELARLWALIRFPEARQ
jgi:hypothetical protein